MVWVGIPHLGTWRTLWLVFRVDRLVAWSLEVWSWCIVQRSKAIESCKTAYGAGGSC